MPCPHNVWIIVVTITRISSDDQWDTLLGDYYISCTQTKLLQSFTGQWVTPLNGSNQISGLKFEAIILILFGICLYISCLL
jgi:hypothetical protein